VHTAGDRTAVGAGSSAVQVGFFFFFRLCFSIFKNISFIFLFSNLGMLFIFSQRTPSYLLFSARSTELTG